MGGFFGTVSTRSCVTDLYYGTDYNSHMGTKRGGMATYSEEKGFIRSIHNLESSYFRSKFEPNLGKFSGNAGVGVISDTDPQPIIINSHLGKFAIVTVARIHNINELERELLAEGVHFSELSSGKTNPTELIALLIVLIVGAHDANGAVGLQAQQAGGVAVDVHDVRPLRQLGFVQTGGAAHHDGAVGQLLGC